MRTAIITLGAALATALAIVPASALTISTNASYEVEHNINGTETDTDGPYSAATGDLESYVSYGGIGEEESFSEEELGSFGDANAYAEASGRLSGGSFLFTEDDVSSIELHSTSTWSDVYTNTTGGTANFDFDFNFSGGRLDIDGNGGMAMFSLDILVDGNSVWNRTASLSGNASSGPVSFDADGLAHIQTGSGNYVNYFFSAFSGNLDLGSFNSGDSFELTYVIETWASTTDEFGYAGANVGDPFQGGFSGTLNAPTSAPVPEPTTMALLGMGIAGLGARRLRKKH